MGIGTSDGEYYETEFDFLAERPQPKKAPAPVPLPRPNPKRHYEPPMPPKDDSTITPASYEGRFPDTEMAVIDDRRSQATIADLAQPSWYDVNSGAVPRQLVTKLGTIDDYRYGIRSRNIPLKTNDPLAIEAGYNDIVIGNPEKYKNYGITSDIYGPRAAGLSDEQQLPDFNPQSVEDLKKYVDENWSKQPWAAQDFGEEPTRLQAAMKWLSNVNEASKKVVYMDQPPYKLMTAEGSALRKIGDWINSSEVNDAIGMVGGLGMIAGKTATTANKSLLTRAEEMAAEGKTPGAIHYQTGWFQGRDGQWKFEINDAGLVQKDIAKQVNIRRDGISLDQVIEHPELFKAYPELKEVGVKIDPREKGGHFDSDKNLIVIGGKAGSELTAEQTSTLLHELQHKVQDVENFNKGASSIETYVEVVNRLSKMMLTYPKGSAEYEAANKALKIFEAPPSGKGVFKTPVDLGYEMYKRNPGEVEARNVEARYERPELRTQPPFATEDIPRKNQFDYWAAAARSTLNGPTGNPKSIPGVRMGAISVEEIAELQDKAANTPSILKRELSSYEQALSEQQRAKYANIKGDTRSFDEWHQVAAEEGHTLSNGSPNAITAAKAYSKKGEPAIIVKADGRRIIFQNGERVYADPFEATPPNPKSIEDWSKGNKEIIPEYDPHNREPGRPIIFSETVLWSKERANALKEMAGLGYTDKEIARQFAEQGFDVTPKAVTSARSDFNLGPGGYKVKAAKAREQIKELLGSGLTIDEIAKEVGIARSGVYRHIKALK